MMKDFIKDIRHNARKILSTVMAFAMVFSMAGLSSITTEAATSSVKSVATVMPSGTPVPSASLINLNDNTLKSWDMGSSWQHIVLDNDNCFTLAKQTGTTTDDLVLHYENVGSLGDRQINADLTITSVEVSNAQYSSGDGDYTADRWIAVYTSGSQTNLSCANDANMTDEENQAQERYPYHYHAKKDIYYTITITYADNGQTVAMPMVQEISDIDQVGAGSYFQEAWSARTEDYSKFYVWDECALEATTTYESGYTTFYIPEDHDTSGNASYYETGVIAVAKSGSMRGHYGGGNCAIALHFAEPTLDQVDKEVTSTPVGNQTAYQLGDEVTFEVTYEMPVFYENEFALYTSMSLSDTLPDELTYKDANIKASSGSLSGNLSHSGQTVTWVADSSWLNSESNYAGQIITLTIVATVNTATLDVNTVTNTGQAIINDVSASATADVPIVRPELSIEKSADRIPPDAYLYNDPDDPDACVVTYTIVVDQTVEGAVAYNAEVRDTLPDEVSLLEVTADGGTVAKDGNSFTVAYDEIAYNAPKTITVTAQTVALGEDIPNTAYATAEIGQNTDEKCDEVKDDALIRIIGPKIEITKDADGYSYRVGDTVEYTIMVELDDESEVDAKGLLVTDELPEGTVLVGKPTVTCQNNAKMATHAEITVAEDGKSFVVEWPVNSSYYLTSDDVIMIHATIKITDEIADTTLTNIAKATAVNTPDEVEAEVPVDVIESGLDIIKEADKDVYTVGDIITYTISVTQTIPDVTADNVVISDDLPTEMSLIDVVASETEDGLTATIARYGDNGFTVRYDHLNYGDTVVLTVTAKALTANENVVNGATARADNTPEITDTAIVDIVEPEYEPDLEIEKTVEEYDHFVDDDVVYTITVKETVEGAVATDVVITDILPDGMTLEDVSVNDETGVVKTEDNGFTVSYDTVGYEDEIVITVTARVNEEARGQVEKNIATVSASNVPDEKESEADIYIEDSGLSITKDVDSETHEVGDEAVYTITVAETVEDNMETNVVVSDSVPDGLTIKHITLAGADGKVNQTGNDFTVEIPELKYSEDAVITVTVEISEDLAGETVTNTAYAKGDHTEEISDDAVMEIPKEEEKEEPKTDEGTTDTGTTNTGTDTSAGEGPKTGDSMNIILWTVLGLLAVGGCTTCVVVYRRRKKI